MNYSKEQEHAIKHVDGPCMVIAGPGSGKTAVITGRIKYLIESAGVSPADILVITFTRAAAREMEQRFKAMTRGKNHQVRFGTFHSIYFWIIKTAYNLNNSSVISNDEKRKLIDKILSGMSLEYENKEDIISSIIAQIGIVKCDMIDIENYYSKDIPEDEFREIYKRFNHEMKRFGKIDFDDMMVMCYELLNKRPDILKRCREIFKYIMIDEFQDSNKIQYEIFKLLAKPLENVFVVGDDDQSVYGFRGARPEIMFLFEKDFKNTRKYYLVENYRCDKVITKVSSKLIADNKKRFDKKLVSNNTSEGKFEIIETEDTNSENDAIISSVREHFAAGIPYEEQAVLYRTNIEPRRLVYKLNQFNIPYTISDTLPNIFEHFVVKGVLNYMRFAMGDRSRSIFLQIMNKPSRYISRNLLLEEEIDFNALRYRARDKEYVVERIDKLIADLRLISKMRPYPALNFIRNAVGFDDYIKDYAEFRQLDEDELYEALDEFASMIVDFKSYGELFEFIEEYSEVLKKQQIEEKDKKGLRLMTMHSSKGLEFDCVYIMNVVDGCIPYRKAKTAGEIEEERRMLYVAMTRARHELYVYTPKEVAGKPKSRSSFLN
ncbi:MAG: ATP-dependent helicase [Lachnospiraceae bacterium]|nr:ATP-dependent helicase [Lachnospiraceae bacterium]MBQ9232984.1 ATP-dependent helicase [Lachnospiraceae bacterium]